MKSGYRLGTWSAAWWVVGVAAALSASAEPPAAALGQPVAATQPAPPVSPPEVVVHLKAGEQITGFLVSADEKFVVVRVAGINTRLPVDTVERYDVLPPILERYEALRKSIGDDPDDIVRLVKWLQAREQYPLALTEVNRALATDPNHGESLRLRSILEQLIVLKASPRSSANHGETQRPAEIANPERRGAAEFPLLTPADINLMKVYEIDLASKPRLIIDRGTMERVLAAYAGNPLVPVTQEGREAIVRRSALENLDLIFKLQARDYYREVEVLDTPSAIKLFRDDVQRTWLMSCATTQCHGGLEAGRLALYNRNPGSDSSVFTNLLILSRFRTSVGDNAAAGSSPRQGEPAAHDDVPGRPLINWDHPERSPLLQLGLPRADSLFPHPVVPRPSKRGEGPGIGDVWRPAFHSTDDRLFKQTLEWIQGMYRPRPEYPVKYTPLRPLVPTRGTAAAKAEPTKR